MKNTRFYKCDTCGNLFGLISGNPDNTYCCDKKIEQIKVNSEYNEKHTPMYERVENEIYVTLKHPMTKEHFITWIALMTDSQTVRVQLYPEGDAAARLPYVKGSTIYAYCNQHGLWETKVK